MFLGWEDMGLVYGLRTGSCRTQRISRQSLGQQAGREGIHDGSLGPGQIALKTVRWTVRNSDYAQRWAFCMAECLAICLG
jgi:hypothetical protein